MLDIDALVMAANRRRLGAAKRLLQFIGVAVGVH